MAQKTPPFHPQETDFSCAVACLRMVLESLGVARSEAELRELCDCTIFGTAALDLIQAARALGFTDSRKYSLELEDLKEITEEGYFPIVYAVTSVAGAGPDVHSLVVISVIGAEITVLDPKQGLRTISSETFSKMWEPMKNLAVVIARSDDSTSS
jgi:ABC-type bacteriocin/lantibiotic exporter with double-glycine peptidase domain